LGKAGQRGQEIVSHAPNQPTTSMDWSNLLMKGAVRISNF
jgi:hypothetical protein